MKLLRKRIVNLFWFFLLCIPIGMFYSAEENNSVCFDDPGSYEFNDNFIHGALKPEAGSYFSPRVAIAWSGLPLFRFSGTVATSRSFPWIVVPAACVVDQNILLLLCKLQT
jgi:hypothetical protein